MFPALSVLSYRTALIQNCGDLPLTFCVDHSSDPALAEAVSVVPSCGLIQPGCHQILMLRTTPAEDRPKEGFSIHLQLNAAEYIKVYSVDSTGTQGTNAVLLATCFLLVFSNAHICLLHPLGTDSCQRGGKAGCLTGRRRQLVFPANSGGLTDAALPPRQKHQSAASTVGWPFPNMVLCIVYCLD